MCRIMEEFAKEEREETRIETATQLLEQGKMSEKEIADFFKFSEEQMKAEKEKV